MMGASDHSRRARVEPGSVSKSAPAAHTTPPPTMDTPALGSKGINPVKSCFSHLRPRLSGQHHHDGAKYLYAYAAHAARNEDRCRLDNDALTGCALGLALAHPMSRA